MIPRWCSARACHSGVSLIAMLPPHPVPPNCTTAVVRPSPAPGTCWIRTRREPIDDARSWPPVTGGTRRSHVLDHHVGDRQVELVLETGGQVGMQPAGQPRGEGEHDDLVELPAADGFCHRTHGI